MQATLWPDLTTGIPPRTVRQMLVDAAGDIDKQTNGDLQFHMDIVGSGGTSKPREARHNCYLRVERTGHLHLLFQVKTPFGAMWPAVTVTPEGDSIPVANSEDELREAVRQVLQRERTKEVLFFLLSTVSRP